MISRFFNKSKPIHSAIASLILTLTFIVAKFNYLSSGLGTIEFLKQLLLLLLSIFSVFLLEFIIGKNALTKRNAFTILIFALLIAILPNGLVNSKLLIANIFVLFALRRIISLQSKLNIKKKFFDATFWILLASLFHFWAILFLLLVILALMYYAKSDAKNWLIPIMVIAMFGVLLVSYNILVYDSWYLDYQLKTPELSFDFTNYNNPKAIMSITLIFTVLIWSSFKYLKKIKNTKGKSKPVFVFVGVATIIALVIVIISPQKNNSEFLFLFAPLAIIMASYLEDLQDIRFKEVLIWILVLAPFVKLML